MSTHVSKKGVQEGPYEDEHIQKLLADGTLSPEDFGWRQGMKDWQKLGTLYPSVRNPAEPPPIPPAAVQKARLPAILSTPQARYWLIGIVLVALAFVAATSDRLLFSFILAVIGGPLLWHGYFPKASAKLKIGLGVVVGVIFVIWGAGIRTHGGRLGFTSRFAPSSSSAERIYALSGDEALAEARKFMVGTWTYTGSEQNFLGTAMWDKWIIKADGTMESYTAHATDDDWGTPEINKWEIIAGKYSNTGERYYAFHIDDHTTQAIIDRDGTVEYRLPDWTLIMERGDKFPFSK